VTSTARDRIAPTEAVAGLCATLAIFLGGLDLLYRPFRLTPVAVVLAILATAMSREQPKLIPIAWASIGIGFIAGATIQLLTHHPLY
jgi:hypothetical protein